MMRSWPRGVNGRVAYTPPAVDLMGRPLVNWPPDRSTTTSRSTEPHQAVPAHAEGVRRSDKSEVDARPGKTLSEK
jgi:hypothetical protein